jgi:hypothetical protein
MSLFDSILPINALNGAVSSIENSVVGLFGFGHTKSNGSEKSYQTLDAFKGEVLNKGNASENRFELMVNTPKCLSATLAMQTQAANLRVESVQFPALNLITKNRHTFGAPQPMPVAADYGGEHGITVTYICDRDMNVKKMFDGWINSIVDNDSQTVAYPDTYTTQMSIAQLDRQDMVVYTVTLKDVYPKTVSAMNANQHSGDWQRVQVTFAYRKWVSQEAAYFQQLKNLQAAKVASLGGDAVKSLSDQISSRATAITGIAQKYGLSTSISGISL